MKKYIILSIILVFSIGLITAGYLIRSGGNSTENGGLSGSGEELRPGGSAGEAGGDYSLAANVLAYSVQNDGVLVIQNGKGIYRISGEEKVEVSSSSASYISASFSPDGKFVLLKTLGGYTVFDLDKKSELALPAGVMDAGWIGNKLAYIEERSSKKFFVTQALPLKARDAFSLFMEDIFILGGDASNIYFAERPSSLTRNSVWKLDLTKKSVSKLFGGNDLHALWDGQNKNFLALVGGSAGYSLKLFGSGGEERASFSSLTAPEKCAFDGDVLYCALPKNYTSKFFENFYEFGAFSENSIYSIRISSGEARLLKSLARTDVAQLRKSGDYLYFINRADEKLYRVPLK